MTLIRASKPAFGRPGRDPRWTSGRKDAIGTAHSRSSRVWYTLARGVLTEIYYPTLDRPQVRDAQFLVTDGATFVHSERRDTLHTVERMTRHSLGLRTVNADREGRYRIVKEVIADPKKPCVLMSVSFEAAGAWRDRLRLYALVNPHIGGTGTGNSAHLAVIDARTVLTATRDNTWMAVAASVPFARASCGFVGVSDGWTDLHRHKRLTWEFDSAVSGNVSLVGELGIEEASSFTLGIAFGNHEHDAATTLLQALARPFGEHRSRFNGQWDRACAARPDLSAASGDDGNLYDLSHSILRAHEDKNYPGAMIASLSIPWGEARGDDDLGGYHLVWPRDMVNSTTALLACGSRRTPLRALIYLAVAQRHDGGFNQNFWLNGEPYWTGIQLDEVAFPILLAWRLHRAGALEGYDPYPMVRLAAGYLVREGPVTEQERWEENAGYSPSTLATNIAALTCAALFARERGEERTATYLQEYADFLDCHLEPWTVTTRGSLLAGVPRHYIRINPVDGSDPVADEDPDRATLVVKNRRPGDRYEFPARDVVDAGFLELVRYGVRRPGDPLIEDSLAVVDAVLRVETPAGPVWRRYNHDGYGQGPKGEPFTTWGVGRGWPLLTGERGHYELAAGRDAIPHLRAMEGFANDFGLLPEQVWDGPDSPGGRFRPGAPTGAAMPLCWAHAEYVKLLRSVVDGSVFDRIPEVAERYAGDRRECRLLEVWKFNRRIARVPASHTLRVQAASPFRLRWSMDDWSTVTDTAATPTGLSVHFVDLAPRPGGGAPIRFTFFWTGPARWEGTDFAVEVLR